MRLARERGHTVSAAGLAGLLELVGDIDLAFDATSARTHVEHARLLAERGIRSVDLTPAALGPAIVPPVNLTEHHDAMEVNLITCGAQATIPIVAAVSKLVDLPYAETVSTVSSRSAGPGTRAQHRRVHRRHGAAAWRRSVAPLRPKRSSSSTRPTRRSACATPSIWRSATCSLDALEEAVRVAVAGVAAYVPGYRLATAPSINDGIANVMVEVEGAGDYLPAYAGNLDIMTLGRRPRRPSSTHGMAS